MRRGEVVPMRVQRLVLAVLVAGCQSKANSPGTHPPRPTEAEEESADKELWAVADAVDPGPQKPLFDVLPAWLRSKVGASPDRTVAVKEIREALLAWDKLRPTGGESFMMGLLSLGRGLILAEQAVAGGVDDPELLLALSRVYAILSNPAFSNEQGMFQQILQFSAMAAMQAKAPGDGEIDAAAVMTALREVFMRAPLLHRRTAAELLRRHGEHPEVPRVLGRLADDDQANERFHGALQLRKLAISRLGTRAKGGDHVDLASTCYRALDVGCGDAALTKARAMGSDKPEDATAVAAFARRIAAVEEQGQRARKIAALTQDPRVKDPKHADLAPALERGHLLVLLGRYDDARAQYEALRAAHPGDARPLAGLAKVTVTDGGDLTGGTKWIEAGRKLANRDREFYEVALGVFGAKLMTEVMPQLMQAGDKLKPEEVMFPLLDDMKEYATGLQAFEPARAGVVLALEGIGRAALPLAAAKDGKAGLVAARELMTRTDALAQKFPESEDVRRLMYLAATMAPDRARALALAKAPLTGKLAGDVEMRRARVKAWADVAMLWDAKEEVAGLVAAVKELPDSSEWAPRTLQGIVLALQHRVTGDREVGISAAALFDAVAADTTAPADARVAAQLNAATLFAWMGDPEGSKNRYEQVLNQDAKSQVALLNLAALFVTHGVHEPKLVEVLEVLAKDADTSTVQLQAQAWRYTQAKSGLGDVEVTRQGFVEKLETMRGGELRGTTPVARLGAFAKGSLNLSLQYQATVGFTIVNQMATTTFLVLPSPDTDELVAAAEAAKKPGKTKPAPKKTAAPAKPAK